MKTAVLLMAYGGPDSLYDIEPYLLDVRGGRPTAPALVEEIRERYEKIGGRSPLLEITRAQAAGLQALLDKSNPGQFQVFVGMRHWKPYIAEAVRQIAEGGYEDLIAICMAPHASRFSTGAYRKKLDEAISTLPHPPRVTFVESWHDEPGYIQAIVENVREAIEKLPADERDRVYTLFSAHSLPAVVLEEGDPYPNQLARTAELVAEGVGLAPGRWELCYQSQGNIPGRWLGPKIDERIPELAARGEKNLLVVTPGFVADHVEVLYDLDIEACEQAEKHGVRLERAQTANTSPAFIEALADIVRKNG
jgi:protoporphyrin/coproporphyrin ferrochelatase